MDDFKVYEFKGMQFVIKYPVDYQSENKYPVLLTFHGA
jgi:enterochelin esterase-like enzyme